MITHFIAQIMVALGGITTPAPVPPPPPITTTVPVTVPTTFQVQTYDPLGMVGAFEALGASESEAETFSCIANHESRYQPDAVNPSSGAGGLFQFLPSTWANIGEAGLAQTASVSDQIAAAWLLYKQQGWSPWAGSCV